MMSTTTLQDQLEDTISPVRIITRCMHKYTGNWETPWNEDAIRRRCSPETPPARPVSDHKTKAHAPASAANAATGTARLGALDGMNPGSCGYSGPLPGGVLPIPMYPPCDGGQFPEPPGYDAGGGGL
jgi:hypothetical protein